jgi:hypothetical protein
MGLTGKDIMLYYYNLKVSLKDTKPTLYKWLAALKPTYVVYVNIFSANLFFAETANPIPIICYVLF